MKSTVVRGITVLVKAKQNKQAKKKLNSSSQIRLETYHGLKFQFSFDINVWHEWILWIWLFNFDIFDS